MKTLWFFNKKRRFQPILDYVEGRMSVTEFKHLFETDKSLQKTLKLPLSTRHIFYREYNYNLFDYFTHGYEFTEGRSWDTYANRYGIQASLCSLLDKYKISYKAYPRYDEEYVFLLKMQPDWVDCQDDNILKSIMDSIPKELSKTKRIAMGKEKIKALFKYDRIYPRWVQAPEWPIVNGKPLVFSHQQKAKGGDIRTYYYFYDEDTKVETVIEQFE